MEALGEDRVGYDTEIARASLFGLRSLRLGKRLKAGMTVTVEPGLYFIPELMDRWRAEGRHASMIDYDRFDEFRRFGGIRIEDDIVVTADGGRVLGPPIAKTADDVEARMGRGDG
jgi:Xaa-Pro aminopeptidase/Xaa-Pro dipeptidase